MITSAEEFIRLRWSDATADYERAAREEASTDVWRDVIQRFPDARVWVARNKTVPAEILETLALDADPAVRLAVAMKRSLAADLLVRLSVDADESVRKRVAMHRNTPRETVERLAQDGDPLVRETANDRMSALE